MCVSISQDKLGASLYVSLRLVMHIMPLDTFVVGLHLYFNVIISMIVCESAIIDNKCMAPNIRRYVFFL
jgi:flagellar biosynthesis component FlhA